MPTSNALKITGHLSVDRLLLYNQTEKLNSHTIIKYSGIVNDSRIKDLSGKISSKSPITVSFEGAPIFCGVPLNVKLDCKNEAYTLYVTCISNSYLLDIDRTSCSFQDISFTYKEVLQKLCSDNNIGEIIFRQMNNPKIKSPIIKYRETDWAFTKRMAARTENIIYPNSFGDSPEVYFGVKETDQSVNDYQGYKEGYLTDLFEKHKHLRDDLTLSDYFYINLKYDNSLSLGDTVSGKNSSIICEKQIYLENDMVYTSYRLGGIRPYLFEEKINHHLGGLTLSGTVIDTKAEQIKLHLDIDPEQDKDTAYWYSYKPMQGNVFYSMPQHGTTAMLKMNKDLDGSGLVTHVIHKNADNVGEMNDYNNRYYTTEFRKRLAMIPDMLDFKSDENLLELHDSKGITSTTTANFKMISEENISIHSKSSIQIATPEKVYSTKVGMDGGIEMSGGEIHIKSLESKLISKSQKTKKRPTLTKCLPAIQIATSLAAKANATVPKQILSKD